jgi:hypothetical protein
MPIFTPHSSSAWRVFLVFSSPLTIKSQSLPSAPNLIPGQTSTRLADGRMLLLGGGAPLAE